MVKFIRKWFESTTGYTSRFLLEMKIRYFSFIALLIVSSCKNTHISNGKYVFVTNDYKCLLNIKQDSSFVLTSNYFMRDGGESVCNGIWCYSSPDTILFKFKPQTDIEKLVSWKCPEHEQKVIVLSKNKIKYEEHILKKMEHDWVIV